MYVLHDGSCLGVAIRVCGDNHNGLSVELARPLVNDSAFHVSLPMCGAGAEAPAGWLVYSDGEGLHVEDLVDLVVDVEVFLDH